jgi:serine/threonine-protein kinase PpkA
VSVEIPNYTLERRLGEGAMAEVWLGEHRRNGRKAAIKILKPAALADESFEKLFLREGQVLASFDHPNIVRIYDNDRVGDSAYLVMEHLPGGTLAERMRRAPITIGETLGLVVQIASALEAAHRQQVIHRDLKPANIMLRDETTPVLTDFGAARLLDRSTIYGKDGMIVGTPVYMSPEQVSGQTLAGSSDLYALGVIFFELLTGERPFPGTSFPEIAAQHLYAPIPQLPPTIAMLQPVLDRLLAKKPEDRYPSAQAFIDALREVFVHDEALRQQVGFAATSMAWSSQLRALGFALDPAQKNQIRQAQGEYLRAASGADSVATQPARAVAPKPTPAISPAPSKVPVWIALGFALAVAAGGTGWWLTRPRPTTAPPVVATPAQTPAPASEDPSADKPAPANPDPAPAAPPPASRERFIAMVDGNVRDRWLDLVWSASDNGADVDWLDAREYCYGRGDGWAPPSFAQLDELYDATGASTQICGKARCQVTPLIKLSASRVWTGEGSGDDLRAVIVDLSNGTRSDYAQINPFGQRALCVFKP